MIVRITIITAQEARQRTERARAEQQAEYDELNEQLEDQIRATAGQVELSKKKDAEVGVKRFISK